MTYGVAAVLVKEGARVLTLIIIPVVYTLIDDLAGFAGRRFRRRPESQS